MRTDFSDFEFGVFSLAATRDMHMVVLISFVHEHGTIAFESDLQGRVDIFEGVLGFWNRRRYFWML